MLQIRKVMEHVFEKVLYPPPGENTGMNNDILHQPIPPPLPPNIEEKIELYCNDQVRFFNLFTLL